VDRPVKRSHLGICTAWLLAGLLAACSPQPKQQPLPKVRLAGPQQEALRRMNEAGATPHQGRTWRFEFGGACVLRVSRSYEGRLENSSDQELAGRRIEVIEYASRGYGVKAYGTGRKGGSADLFDAASDVDANAFAMQVRKLVDACGQGAEAPGR
jgi:hypothetical protein